MRHRKAGRQLGRNTSHRNALLRNMVTSLFKHEQIETTDAKAKTMRPLAEKMITLAKRGDLHARRQALAYMKEKEITHRLFDELKDRYLDRQGGYLRIIKKGVRRGDGAPISIVQLLPKDQEKVSPGKKKKKEVVKSAGTKGKKEAAIEKEKKKVEEKQNMASNDVAVEEKEEIAVSDNTDPIDRENG